MQLIQCIVQWFQCMQKCLRCKAVTGFEVKQKFLYSSSSNKWKIGLFKLYSTNCVCIQSYWLPNLKSFLKLFKLFLWNWRKLRLVSLLGFESLTGVYLARRSHPINPHFKNQYLLQYSIVLFSAMECNIVIHYSAHYSIFGCSAVQCSAVSCSAVQCSAVQSGGDVLIPLIPWVEKLKPQ